MLQKIQNLAAFSSACQALRAGKSPLLLSIRPTSPPPCAGNWAGAPSSSPMRRLPPPA